MPRNMKIGPKTRRKSTETDHQMTDNGISR